MGSVYSANGMVEGSQLVGTWRLNKSTRVDENGRKTQPWGESAIGFITFTKDGWMSLNIQSRNRPIFDAGHASAGTPSEKVAAFDSFISYAGRFDIVGDTIHNFVEASSFPNWVGTVLVRRTEIRGDSLTLTSVSDGPRWVNEWTRAHGR